MIFEFIIIHKPQKDEPILDILRERLREVLEANLNDVEEDALNHILQINFERSCHAITLRARRRTIASWLSGS